MAKKKSLLEKMKGNPKGDWGIKDIETLCRKYGLTITPPSSGSHYIVSSRFVEGALPVPARRPIKPIYIRKLVGLCEAHVEYENENGAE